MGLNIGKELGSALGLVENCPLRKGCNKAAGIAYGYPAYLALEERYIAIPEKWPLPASSFQTVSDRLP